MVRLIALTILGIGLTCVSPGLTPAAIAQDEAVTADETTTEAAAEEAPAEEAMEAEVEEVVEEEASPFGGGPDEMEFAANVEYSFNTIVMFLCAVLVLFMQAGFCMVEAGLNSSKNVINIIFKNLMDLSVGVLLYLFIGYALMYPGDDYAGKWFGYGGSAMVPRDAQTNDDGTWAEPPSSLTWSNSADFLFQVAFAATAATIVSGAVAGRMKFVSYLIYSAVLTGLIYPISGMWKWGGGALAEMGFADFAGSVVVHAVGGFAGLAGAIALGPRIGRYNSEGKSVPIPGHNITVAALGVLILWVGWYGFNPGSQLTYFGATNAEATSYIALTTTIAAAAGAVAAMIIGWGMFGKPDVTLALNGALAGLVGITANCDQVSQTGAIIIGAVAGVLVVLGIVALDKLKIDDPVGAFPVHGLCGVWGGIATGILGASIPDGMDRAGYIMVQVKSTVIISVWAFVTMFILFMALKAIGMLRVSADEEAQGLDIGEHGMQAYTP